MRPLHRARGHPRRGLATILALLVSVGAAATHPIPAEAAGLTPAAVEATLLTLANRDRVAIGLRPLRSDGPLVAIARRRAANLVAASTISHQAAGGDMAPVLAAAGVQWYGWGENIALWPGGLTSTTAAQIHQAWRDSPSHWAMLMSRTMNYGGFGVAVRGSDGRVFASTVFTQSRDHTAPGVRIGGATRSGTTITFAWQGLDPVLQTHWAGLRDFDAWYRVDGGSWRLVRNNTTATSLRLASRAGGHRYWLIVTARDRAGNVGRPSAPVSVWVP